MARPQFGSVRPTKPGSAVGQFFRGPRPYGFAAAPTRPGRRVGGGNSPVLHGLFQSGARPNRQISPIVIMQNNIHRGQG